MPVLIDTHCSDHHLVARGAGVAGPPTAGTADIDIGLVNNMPDAALMATERQVFDLLAGAAKNLTVRLHFYTMETTPRSDWGQSYAKRFFLGVGELVNRRLDGVIVTGAEPKAADLTDEPYWATFGRLVDWAKENTTSTVFSCLAVHGAVLHIDGVRRRALPAKCIGVFAQSRTIDHDLMRDVPTTFRTPHARWNEVPEDCLSACGYSVLARSAEAGVDCFVKQQQRSLFVHFQGHPEYDAQSLLGEYRRDLGRFLRRENDICPTIPKGYLNREAAEIMAAFRRKAISNRSPELFASFPVDRLARDLRNVWQPTASRIYRNWLSYLDQQRNGKSAPLSSVGTAA
jgi:homoserine O-succinyltransferase